MIIRTQRPDDYHAILRLTYEAFLTGDYPGRRRVDEHYLISLLQDSPMVIEPLCFVAERDGAVVGHILYTKSEIRRPDGGLTESITFGPLSVLPAHHRQGVGAALVGHSLERARALGHGAVLITGVPDYYPKLGFRRAREYGLTLPDGTAEDFFMAYELVPGYLAGGGVLRFLPPEFERSERDDAEFEAFHRWFAAGTHPGALTLRPFFDGDIARMEGWLHMPHVARWYKRPDHWLGALRQRRGAFSFLTHFIAEFEGQPVGFCQYYDTFFAQKHGGWSDRHRACVRQGEVFGIDCLIGAPEQLRRGFGREMAAQLLRRLRAAGARAVVADPEGENLTARRALEAVGFTERDGAYEIALAGPEQGP